MTMAWRGLALVALTAASSAALAQQTPVFQFGTMSAGDAVKFATNGGIHKAGGLTGDANGRGLNPFAATDSLGLGFCSNSASSKGQYNALCVGHDSSGNGLVTLDSYGGYAQKALKFRINGSTYDFPGNGQGNILGPNSSAVGNAISWNNTTGTLVRDEGAPGLLHVDTNTALKALSGIAGKRVVRKGFTTAADGGGNVPYDWSGSNCTAADNGAQVQPNTTGCWIADFSSLSPTPQIWGAKGDGVTNDNAAVQAAITALAGKTLYLGGKKYCITGVTISKVMSIVGTTRGDMFQADGRPSGFVACGEPTTLITVAPSSNGTTLRDFYINAKYGNTASNTAISTLDAGATVLEHILIDSPCIGIDDSSNSTRARGIQIQSAAAVPAVCVPIRVGQTQSAIDFRLSDTTINVAGAEACVKVLNAGGPYFTNNGLLGCNVGTKISPGANQIVDWLFASNTVLSDTTTSHGMLIDATAASAQVRNAVFVGSWTSSATGAGVLVQNTGGGVVNGVRLIGHRSIANSGNGIEVGTGVTGVAIDDSEICGNNVASGGHGGIRIADGASKVSVRGTRSASAATCATPGGSHSYGIFSTGTISDVIIVGNDLTGNGAPFSGTVTGASIIENNKEIDTQVPQVASGASISLPVNPLVGITGTTTVTNISGAWTNRTVRLVTLDGAVTFSNAGVGTTRICNTVASAGVFASVSLTYVGGLSCWSAK